MLTYTYLNPRKLIITDFYKYSQDTTTKKKEEENRKLSRLKRLRRLKMRTIITQFKTHLWAQRKDWLDVHH